MEGYGSGAGSEAVQVIYSDPDADPGGLKTRIRIRIRNTGFYSILPIFSLKLSFFFIQTFFPSYTAGGEDQQHGAAAA
jgi:hypothetical protein